MADVDAAPLEAELPRPVKDQEEEEGESEKHFASCIELMTRCLSCLPSRGRRGNAVDISLQMLGIRAICTCRLVSYIVLYDFG
jgi:hypothetical protein